MALRDCRSAEDLTETSVTGDTDWHEKLTLTFTPKAGTAYAVFWSGEIKQSTDVAGVWNCQFHDNGATQSDQYSYADNPTDWVPIGGIYYIAASGTPVSHALLIRFGQNSASDTIKIKNTRIVALELTTNDSYAESLTDSSTTSSTPTNKVSNNITVPGGGGTYAIFTTYVGKSLATDLQSGLLLDQSSANVNLTNAVFTNTLGDRSAWWHMTRVGGNGKELCSGFVKATWAAGAHKAELFFASGNNSSNVTVCEARVLILRLDDGQFGENFYAELTSAGVTTSSQTYSDVATTGAQTYVGGDYLVFGHCAQYINASGYPISPDGCAQAMLDSTVLVDQNYGGNGTPGTKPLFVAAKATLAAGSHTINVQRKVDTTPNTQFAVGAVLAVQVAPPATVQGEEVARDWAVAEGMAETTTTSNTVWKTQCSLTFTPKDGKDYVLIWSASFQPAYSYAAWCGLADAAGTELDTQNGAADNKSTGVLDYLFAGNLYKITGDGTQKTFTIRFMSYTNGQTTKCKNARIIALELTSDDAYAEDLTRSTTTQGDMQTKLTGNITVPAGGHNYLIIASGVTDAGYNDWTNIGFVVDSNWMYNRFDTVTPSDFPSQDNPSVSKCGCVQMRKYALAAGAHSAQVQWYSAGANTFAIQATHILFLCLDNFAEHAYAEDTNISESLSIGTSWADRCSAYAGFAGGNYLLLGRGSMCRNSATAATEMRTYLDTIVLAEHDRTMTATGLAGANEHFVGALVPLAAGSHTLKLQVQNETASDTSFAQGAVIAIKLPARDPRDVQYAEGLTEQSTTSATVWTTQATLTFTPKANANYVIFWSGSLYLGSTTSDGQADLYDVTNSQELVLQNIEGLGTSPVDYVGVGGLYYLEGIGAEPSGNLLAEPYFTANWTAQNTTITPNADPGPDGSMRAITIKENNTTGYHNAYRTMSKAASAIEYWLSLWVKQSVGTRTFQIESDDSGANGVAGNFDLSTGEWVTAPAAWNSFTLAETFIDKHSNGWYHVGLRFTSSTATTLALNLGLVNAGNPSYAGDNTSTHKYWRARLALAADGAGRLPTATERQFAVRFKSETAGVTTKMKDARIVALELTSDDVYGESLPRQTQTSGLLDAFQTNITVPTGGGEYLVACSCHVDISNIANLVGWANYLKATGIDENPIFSRNGGANLGNYLSARDTTNRTPWVQFVKKTLAAGPCYLTQTIDTDATGGIEQMRTLFLRLDDARFGENFYTEITDSSETAFGSENYSDAIGIYYDSTCKLLLHMDGADESTTFIDSSAANRSITPYGNAKIDSAQSKFGGTAAYFDGTGDYLLVPNDSDLAPGSNEFTFQCWYRPSSVAAGYHTIFSGRDVSDANAPIWLGHSGTQLKISISTTPTGYLANDVNWGTAIAADTWYHIALVRTGNTFYVFQDGVRTTVGTRAEPITAIGGSWNIGADHMGSGNYAAGWIDELSMEIGIARWTAAFAPPTAPLSPAPTFSGGNYLLLGHCNYTISDTTHSEYAKIVLDDATTLIEQNAESGPYQDVECSTAFVAAKATLSAAKHTLKVQKKNSTGATAGEGTLGIGAVLAIRIGDAPPPTARDIQYAEGLAEQTTTDGTNYTTQCTLTFTPKANKDYIIFWACSMQPLAVNVYGQVSLYDVTNTTSLADGQLASREATYYAYSPMGGMYKLAANASPPSRTFTIRFKASTAGTTIKCRDARLMAIELNANDVYAEDLTDTYWNTGSNTYKWNAPFTKVTASWTCPGATYLAFASCKLRDVGLDYCGMRMVVDATTPFLRPGNCSTTPGGAPIVFMSPNNQVLSTAPSIMFSKQTVAAGSRNAYLQIDALDANGIEQHYSDARLLLMRLDDNTWGENFANEVGPHDVAGSNSYAAENTLTATLEGGDYLCFGWAAISGGGAQWDEWQRIYLDSTSNLLVTEHYYECQAGLNPYYDSQTTFVAAKVNLSAGSHSLVLQRHDENAPTQAEYNASGLLFLKIPAGEEAPLIDLILGSDVLDNGLADLADATLLHILSDQPTTYAEVATYTLGNGSVTVGAPGAVTGGRKVTVSAVSGTTTDAGDAVAWALVDASRLLATGKLSGTVTVGDAAAFDVATFDIKVPVN